MGHLDTRYIGNPHIRSHSKSELAQKEAVLTTLARRVRMLCDTENRGGEIHILNASFSRTVTTRMISGELYIQNRSQN
jgi:hypothetical protein